MPVDALEVETFYPVIDNENGKGLSQYMDEKTLNELIEKLWFDIS